MTASRGPVLPAWVVPSVSEVGKLLSLARSEYDATRCNRAQACGIVATLQGVAVRPGTDRLFVTEHGPDVDDEINILRAGASYGWDPSRGGYNENVPMTDLQRFPDAVSAVWSSGGNTEAICGAAFITGQQWGTMKGLLAVAALKGTKLLLTRVDPNGTVTEVGHLPQLDGNYGRLRAVRAGDDGVLYVTTSAGDTTRCSEPHPPSGSAGATTRDHASIVKAERSFRHITDTRRSSDRRPTTPT